MNQAVNDIAAILLQKELKDADETQLRRLAEEHPYFAAAQLLLAAKLQQNDDAQFWCPITKDLSLCAAAAAFATFIIQYRRC